MTEVPRHIAYAATVNAFLADLQLRDDFHDSAGSWTARFKRKALGDMLADARLMLESMGVNVLEVMALFEQQIQRESEGHIESTAQATLEWYGECTALITSLMFKSGAEYVGALEPNRFADLGYNFGKLVYLVDALDDQEKDRKRGEFNPLSLIGENWAHLTANGVRMLAVREVECVVSEMAITLRSLPGFDDEGSEEVIHRISTSVEKRLYGHTARKEVPQKNVTEVVRESWHIAKARTQTLFSNLVWRVPLATVLILMFLILPKNSLVAQELRNGGHVMRASNDECCGFIFFIVCIGAIIQSCCYKEEVNRYEVKERVCCCKC